MLEITLVVLLASVAGNAWLGWQFKKDVKRIRNRKEIDANLQDLLAIQRDLNRFGKAWVKIERFDPSHYFIYNPQ